MRIATISFALVAMTCVFTEALTLHARESDTVSLDQHGKNALSNGLSSTSHNVKRTTPDYSSSSITTLRDRLVAKRQDNKDAASQTTKEGLVPKYSCQEYINGVEAVLVSAEASIKKVSVEVTSRKPSQDVLDKLEKINSLVAKIRTDNEAAKATNYKTQETADTLVSTATDLHNKVKEYRDLLEETTTGSYKDLVMYAGDIESYGKDYVKKGCVTAV
ncbi:hypothetical protein BG015_003331 [Linnemannia schmuckeri]|uniref:Uncharacterized protein n=1 Tax=Linnemannia schmuckeri TaxID=64567 RepID=A0A9P5RLE6_9FUNG|nr:hypothetical protein BG015_003331 [Linnemannia schmuckeri]